MPPPIPLETDEVGAAADFFLKPGNLCFFTGSISNSGFAASVSFNSPEFRTSRGSLTLSLRHATITLYPPRAGAEWHEDISELVNLSSRTVQLKDAMYIKDSDLSSDTLDAAVEGKGTFKWPLIGEIGIGSRVAQGRKRDRGNERSRTKEQTVERTVRDIEMQRHSATAFQLTLHAEPGSDLVQHNPHLARLNILAFDNLGDLRAEQVTVTMSANLEETETEWIHSLRVRGATGCWKGLQATNNHRIVGELLLSKLVRPVHERRVIWPDQRHD
jgi:hypothetical protein